MFRTNNQQYIQYEGTNTWSRQLQKYLNDKLVTVVKLHPKLAKHIEGRTIQILDEFKGNNVAGFFHRLDETINIVAGNIDSRSVALHVLFHEIGHSVVFYRQGISKDYDPVEKNPAYYREEIKADSYALEIFTKYLHHWQLRDYLEDSIKRLYQGLKGAIYKQKRRYSYYDFGSGFTITASSGTHSYVSISGSSNNVTWTGSYSWSVSTSSTTYWSGSVSFAC